MTQSTLAALAGTMNSNFPFSTPPNPRELHFSLFVYLNKRGNLIEHLKGAGKITVTGEQVSDKL